MNQQLAIEIKEKAKFKKSPSSKKLSTPELLVEDDVAGGAGRAGFIEVKPGVWVSVKGPGVTGMGRTRNLMGPANPSPPLNEHVNHADGGVTMLEGMYETIMSNSADAERRSGASRVIGMIGTGRYREHADGSKEELVLLLRSKVPRLGGTTGNGLTNESLGEANAKRFFKGDFLNGDNMGKRGEWIDFALTTHTSGYAPFVSAEGQPFFNEGHTLLYTDTEVYKQSIGKNFLNQMGIPEQHIQKFLAGDRDSPKKMEKFGTLMTDLVEQDFAAEEVRFNPRIRLSYDDVSKDELHGNVHFHEFQKDAAANYFNRGELTLEELKKVEIKRLQHFVVKPSPSLDAKLGKYVSDLHSLFQGIEKANHLENLADYGEKIRLIAHFKNREADELIKPKLLTTIENFLKTHTYAPSPEAMNQFIEHTVLNNRFTTAPAADANFIARANDKATEIFVRAHREPTGSIQLFRYPELNGVKEDIPFEFKLSTDGGKSFQRFRSEFLNTSVGDYLKISVPHGSMPITSEGAQLMPMVENAKGLTLHGPPLLFNERLGLPADLTRRLGSDRVFTNEKNSIMPWDLSDAKDSATKGSAAEKEPLTNLIRDLASMPKTSTLQYEMGEALKPRIKIAQDLYAHDHEFKNLIDTTLNDIKGMKHPLEADLKRIAKPRAESGTCDWRSWFQFLIPKATVGIK